MFKLWTFVVGLVKAETRASGQCLDDSLLEFSEGAVNGEGQDTMGEGHPIGLAAAYWEGEHGGAARVNELTDGGGGLVAQFAGEDERGAESVGTEGEFEPLAEGFGGLFVEAEGGAEVFVEFLS